MKKKPQARKPLHPARLPEIRGGNIDRLDTNIIGEDDIIDV